MKLLPLLNLAVATVALTAIATPSAQAMDEWIEIGRIGDNVITLNLTQSKPTDNKRIFFIVYGLVNVQPDSSSQPQVAGATVVFSGMNCRTKQVKLLSSMDDRGEDRDFTSGWFSPHQLSVEALVLNRVCR